MRKSPITDRRQSTRRSTKRYARRLGKRGPTTGPATNAGRADLPHGRAGKTGPKYVRTPASPVPEAIVAVGGSLRRCASAVSFEVVRAGAALAGFVVGVEKRALVDRKAATADTGGESVSER